MDKYAGQLSEWRIVIIHVRAEVQGAARPISANQGDLALEQLRQLRRRCLWIPESAHGDAHHVLRRQKQGESLFFPIRSFQRTRLTGADCGQCERVEAGVIGKPQERGT